MKIMCFKYNNFNCSQIVIESSTGSTSKSMVHLTLTIAVKKTHFDVQLSQLRVSGRNISKNNHVRVII